MCRRAGREQGRRGAGEQGCEVEEVLESRGARSERCRRAECNGVEV